MRTSALVSLFLVTPMASVLAQTPPLQTNVVYVCTDGQSFKVFSCDNTTGACDYQNYKKGQAYQRGQALKVQLAALLPAKCHAQTPAEAQADPHRGEIPAAPSPFKVRADAGSNGAGTATAIQSGPGPGGFKVGDTVRVLVDGWQEATIIEVHGRSYVVHLPNGINVSKMWPYEIHRLGKLTAEDHAAGQYDLHDRVQVLVNGKWMEGEIRGQNNVNMYDIKVPGVDTGFGSDIVNTTPENIRMSTTPAPAAPAQRAAGQAPQPGLASCAGKYEGRWEHVSGMGGMKVVFRSGKATITEGLGGEMLFDCFTGDGKVVFYKAGSFTPFSYDFDVNNDGSCRRLSGPLRRWGIEESSGLLTDGRAVRLICQMEITAMKTTQAWVWLAAGVLALGLNGIYQDGGAAWAHRIADGAIERVAHRSQGLVDLAAERVDRFVEGANLVAVRDETASCRLAAAMARIEARAARVRMVPVAFNAVEIPMVVCPRVRASAPRVSVPRLPVVRIPAPAVHVEMVGAGPV